MPSYLIWTVGTNYVDGPEPSYEEAVARVERRKRNSSENGFEYEIIPTEFPAHSTGRTQEEKEELIDAIKGNRKPLTQSELDKLKEENEQKDKA